MNAIHQHIVFCQCEGGTFCQTVHRVLRGGIHGVVTTGSDACNGGGIHDPSPMVLFHVLSRGFQAIEYGHHVDLHGGAEGFLCKVLQRRLVGNPGIVDDNADVAETLMDLLHRLLPIRKG